MNLNSTKAGNIKPVDKAFDKEVQKRTNEILY